MQVFKPPAELPKLPPADWEEEDRKLRENAPERPTGDTAWERGWERLIAEWHVWRQAIEAEDKACQQRAERLWKEFASPTRQERSWARHRQRCLLEAQCEGIRRAGEVAAIAAAAAAALEVRQRYQAEIKDRLEAFDLANPIKR